MKEIWKSIIGYEGLYEVSNLGRIKSLARRRRPTEKILSPGPHKGGYHLIHLCKEGIIKSKLIHHLVLEAFVGPCPEGMECRHFPDKNPKNNILENLSWGTSKENKADKILHRTNKGPQGVKNFNAKLTENQIKDIRDTKSSWGIQTKLANKYGVSTRTISGIIRKELWKHII